MVATVVYLWTTICLNLFDRDQCINCSQEVTVPILPPSMHAVSSLHPAFPCKYTHNHTLFSIIYPLPLYLYPVFFLKYPLNLSFPHHCIHYPFSIHTHGNMHIRPSFIFPRISPYLISLTMHARPMLTMPITTHAHPSIKHTQFSSIISIISTYHYASASKSIFSYPSPAPIPNPLPSL